MAPFPEQSNNHSWARQSFSMTEGRYTVKRRGLAPLTLGQQTFRTFQSAAAAKTQYQIKTFKPFLVTCVLELDTTL